MKKGVSAPMSQRRPGWPGIIIAGCLLLVGGMSWHGAASSLFAAPLFVAPLFVAPVFAVPERGNPAARLLPGEFAYERWELTARFDSGHFFFTEFLITNLGFGDRNAAVIGHVIQPNGQSRRFRTGRRESRWELSPDRLRMEVGSSWLDQHGPKNALQVKKKRTHVALDFYPSGSALWSTDFPPSGYAIDLLDPAARAEGDVWVKGMAEPAPIQGSVAVTHSWTNAAESDLVLRRLEFFSLPSADNTIPEMSLYLADLTTPQGTQSRWLVAKNGHQVVHQAHNFDVTFDGEVQNVGNYHVPQQLHFESERFKGSIQLNQLLLRHDPLDDIPQPFRFLIALKLKPRRVWLLSPFHITFQSDQTSEPMHLTGTGVTKVSFLNPLPRPEVTVSLFPGLRDFRATGSLQ